MGQREKLDDEQAAYFAGEVGHCAGPSWAAHQTLVVPVGDRCPSCGTVMPGPDEVGT